MFHLWGRDLDFFVDKNTKCLAEFVVFFFVIPFYGWNIVSKPFNFLLVNSFPVQVRLYLCVKWLIVSIFNRLITNKNLRFFQRVWYTFVLLRQPLAKQWRPAQHFEDFQRPNSPEFEKLNHPSSILAGKWTIINFLQLKKRKDYYYIPRKSPQITSLYFLGLESRKEKRSKTLIGCHSLLRTSATLFSFFRQEKREFGFRLILIDDNNCALLTFASRKDASFATPGTTQNWLIE